MNKQEFQELMSRIFSKNIFFDDNCNMSEILSDLFVRWDDDENIYVGLNCNDVFWWGCADLEELTLENIDELFKAYEDSDWNGAILFCCRQRKMRPQGAYYKYIEEDDVELFNACGPEREVGLGNPYSIEQAIQMRRENQLNG